MARRGCCISAFRGCGVPSYPPEIRNRRRLAHPPLLPHFIQHPNAHTRSAQDHFVLPTAHISSLHRLDLPIRKQRHPTHIPVSIIPTPKERNLRHSPEQRPLHPPHIQPLNRRLAHPVDLVIRTPRQPLNTRHPEPPLQAELVLGCTVGGRRGDHGAGDFAVLLEEGEEGGVEVGDGLEENACAIG